MAPYDELTRRALLVVYKRGLHFDTESLRVIEKLTDLSWKQIKQWMKTKRFKDKRRNKIIPNLQNAESLHFDLPPVDINVLIIQNSVIQLAYEFPSTVQRNAPLIAEILGVTDEQILRWGTLANTAFEMQFYSEKTSNAAVPLSSQHDEIRMMEEVDLDFNLSIPQRSNKSMPICFDDINGSKHIRPEVNSSLTLAEDMIEVERCYLCDNLQMFSTRKCMKNFRRTMRLMHRLSKLQGMNVCNFQETNVLPQSVSRPSTTTFSF